MIEFDEHGNTIVLEIAGTEGTSVHVALVWDQDLATREAFSQFVRRILRQDMARISGSQEWPPHAGDDIRP